ncbi:Smr/MutS family protein [Dokdonia sp.]|uniref:Smr/MutS family protein n=1 Tax=Dokdonia sp. TaxID=2024995 RepID=UPI003262D7A3
MNNKFTIGQSVQVLDDDLEGVIIEIDTSFITIETTEGFLIRFRESEIIPSISNTIKDQLIDVPHQMIHQKEEVSRTKSTRIKPKERNLPPMEVDLHIHQLTKSYKGLSNHEILTLQIDTAERQLRFAISKRIPKVVFIHGVGQGVLKEELYHLFRCYDGIKYYDADYQKYGTGATEIYIYQNAQRN